MLRCVLGYAPFQSLPVLLPSPHLCSGLEGEGSMGLAFCSWAGQKHNTAPSLADRMGRGLTPRAPLPAQARAEAEFNLRITHPHEASFLPSPCQSLANPFSAPDGPPPPNSVPGPNWACVCRPGEDFVCFKGPAQGSLPSSLQHLLVCSPPTRF